MRQSKLTSFIGKLCIWVVYLLFLSVQLNFKYTFPDSSFTTIYSSTAKIKASKDAKPFVQKLRLNKRYERGQVYQIESQPELPIIVFSAAPDQPVIPDQIILAPGLITSCLRGPPSTFAFSA